MPPRHERSYNMRDEPDNRYDAKRRKVRKGTRSCWECRRRKMKCIFASETDAICISCRRRGAKCVGQEFPEEISAPLDRCLQMGDRLVRVEALLGQLLERIPSDADAVNGHTTGTHNGKEIQDILTGASADPDAATGLESCQYAGFQPVGQGRYGRLSQVLHKSLPSREDIARIAEVSSDVSILFYQMLTVPYNRIGSSEPKSHQSLLEIPGPQAHPVLIARHMLHLATSLQHLHPDLYQGIKELSESPREMMKRLAETAINLVTRKEDLTGSIEGLECIMIESLYLANSGNLRQSLVAIRRAIITAQLMGFHRPTGQAQYKVLDPKTEAHPQYVWFRIVSAERHLCLMLGLPQGTVDHSMASEAMLVNDTMVGRLERLHCVIAARILERNQSRPSSADFALTQELDAELQRAAGRLPSKWWLTANPATTEGPEALFWEVRRLFNQSFHYNLLNQLHLPYMLRSSTEHKYEYSRLTCVNASREVLTRFIMFRGLDQIAFRCRTVDFFALMAAMTLLLAHIDEHRRCAVSLTRLRQQTQKPGNILAHQRLGDRAMMEQAQESMEEVCRLTEDALSAQSADLLRRLLAIEAEAALGYSHRAEGVSVSVQTRDLAEDTADEIAEQPSGDGRGGMRVHIPYFGIIKIAGNSVVSREAPEYQLTVPGIRHAGAGSDPGGSAVFTTGYSSTLDIPRPAELPPAYGSYSGKESETETGIRDSSAQYRAGDCGIITPDPFQPLGDITEGGLPQQHEYPLLTTEVGDLSFQGVDAAFFDSLMRGAGDGHDGTGWPVWPSEC